MASGTFAWYGSAFAKAFNKEIDWNDGNTKFAFSSSSYTPDNDAHDYFNDVTNEVTGTNWSAGGVTLSNCSISIDTSNNRVRFFADDIAQATVTATGFRVGVIYSNTGTAATSPLIGYITFDGDMSPNAGTQTVDFDGTNGIGRVTY